MKKITPWTELKRETMFTKYGRAIDKVLFRLPDGTESDFYLLDEVDGVGIVAITKDEQVLLVEQFRPGTMRILKELPAGGRDKNETPAETARRELLEETGYMGKLQFAGSCVDDAYSNQMRYCFVATDCVPVNHEEIGDEVEMKLLKVSLPEFREILRRGELTDVELGYMGLDFLGLL